MSVKTEVNCSTWDWSVLCAQFAMIYRPGNDVTACWIEPLFSRCDLMFDVLFSTAFGCFFFICLWFIEELIMEFYSGILTMHICFWSSIAWTFRELSHGHSADHLHRRGRRRTARCPPRQWQSQGGQEEGQEGWTGRSQAGAWYGRKGFFSLDENVSGDICPCR